MSESDPGRSPERWEFDADVTRVFDDMLARSIPQFETMRSAVFELGSRFVVPPCQVLDIGASRGGSIAPFVDRFGALASFHLVEISEPMLEALRARFRGMIEASVVTVHAEDLRRFFPPVRPSLVLSVLTLQFVPINYRPRIVTTIHERLQPGGALVVVEKVLGESAGLDDAFVAIYHEKKRRSGYDGEAIRRKALALEGVLVPLSASSNVELLRAAGFSRIDCFWRWMNFAGWVAVKP